MTSSPLPWDPEHQPRFARTTRTSRSAGSRPARTVEYEWRHTVYLWVFPLEALYQALERVFPFDDESYDPRPGGESALASFVVDQEGYLLADSPVLAACGWAAGVVGRNPGQVDRLDGLESAQEQWLRRLSEIVASRAGDPADPRPLDSHAVRTIADMTAAFTRFPNLSGAGPIRVLSQQIRTDGAQDVQADFLNSFFLDDLSVVARAAEGARSSDPTSNGPNGIGRALSRYLTERVDVPLDRRIDVQHDLSAVLAATAPQRMPDGRWPSDPGKPLALSQQLAVNLITEDAGAGLFAVNGPPGTGKTTMLRDLFAARVVERAHRLAALEDHPEHGFGPPLPSWRSEGHPRTVHPLAPQLTGFEMVVASSNNAAVANVSDEIPAADAIASCYQNQVDYFADIATALLQPVPEEENDSDVEEEGETVSSSGETTEEARTGWALAAARLGNKKNRSSFKTRFWIGDKALDLTYEAMQPLLSRSRGDRAAEPTWSEAVSSFRSAVAAEKDVIAVRQRVADALDQLLHTSSLLAEAEGEWRSAAQSAQSAAAEADRLAAQLDDAQEQLSSLDDVEASRRPPRPGSIWNLLTLGWADRRWAAQGGLDPAEAEERRRVTARLERLTQAHSQADERYRSTGQVLDRLRQTILLHQAVKDQATRVLDEAPNTWGDALPSPIWWHRDVERREKTAPWLDQEVNDLRVKVLLAALALHRAFVSSNAATFENSLRAAVDVMSGAAPAEPPPATRLAAWQVLFMVVPLVSTTFASVGRMFQGIPAEGLGWLLIDEAGQSAPQLAVGAMWRAQNVVVVGDPRQLQPVVTITPRLEGALAKAYGVDRKWRPLTTSVQAVADDVNRWGTWLAPVADEPRLWVGAPLRVHRRCDQPMLDICNEIAYPVDLPRGAVADQGTTGLMIDAVPARQALPLPRSQWYHHRATSWQGHVAPSELALLRRLLDQVLLVGVPLGEVICISPFRDTAARLSDLKNVYGDQLRGGTIHTAQGQEADVVFLVLGGDPTKPGAKTWASRTPNLVNVAVSRARRRLYVIGDRAAWSSHPFFGVLSGRLERDDGPRGDLPEP